MSSRSWATTSTSPSTWTGSIPRWYPPRVRLSRVVWGGIRPSLCCGVSARSATSSAALWCRWLRSRASRPPISSLLRLYRRLFATRCSAGEAGPTSAGVSCRSGRVPTEERVQVERVLDDVIVGHESRRSQEEGPELPAAQRAVGTHLVIETNADILLGVVCAEED